jgi:hypothetical protein
MAKGKSQISGQASQASPLQKRKPKKPKAVSAVDRTINFIKSIDVNPFD